MPSKMVSELGHSALRRQSRRLAFGAGAIIALGCSGNSHQTAITMPESPAPSSQPAVSPVDPNAGLPQAPVSTIPTGSVTTPSDAPTTGQTPGDATVTTPTSTTTTGTTTGGGGFDITSLLGAVTGGGGGGGSIITSLLSAFTGGGGGGLNLGSLLGGLGAGGAGNYGTNGAGTGGSYGGLGGSGGTFGNITNGGNYATNPSNGAYPTNPASGNYGNNPSTAAGSTDGAALYQTKCLKCHADKGHAAALRYINDPSTAPQMPSVPLTSDEKQTLISYLSQG